MEEREFAICYRKLIEHYRLTPEENSRQLARILRCLGPPGSNKEEYKLRGEENNH